MRIVVLARDSQWEELQPATIRDKWLRVYSENNFFENTDADIYINLLDEADTINYSSITKPIFINSVTTTLKEMNATSNVLRINGWNSFLSGADWEVAGIMDEAVKQFFSILKKKYIIVPDKPGLIAPRIIAMIINEAYFALEEEVSKRNEIDIAMKLGTNYPYGPFEWSEKIGLKNIYALLQKLGTSDTRYMPAPLLQQEAER